MPEIHDVVKTYRTARNLSFRKFADEINSKLINTDVSYGTVKNWENEDKPYEPDMRLLFECLAIYRDWKAEWAKDCLHSMFPDLFQSGIVCVNLPRAE